VIFRVWKLEIIYSKYVMLYDIIPNEPRSTLNLEKPKSTPHVDGIMGSFQSKVADLITNQMQNLAIQ